MVSDLLTRPPARMTRAAVWGQAIGPACRHSRARARTRKVRATPKGLGHRTLVPNLGCSDEQHVSFLGLGSRLSKREGSLSRLPQQPAPGCYSPQSSPIRAPSGQRASVPAKRLACATGLAVPDILRGRWRSPAFTAEPTDDDLHPVTPRASLSAVLVPSPGAGCGWWPSPARA
jgi:hypothetical protein